MIYPRVQRPTTDTCHVCHALGHETCGYVWYPTHEGDRPMCRTHVLAYDPDAHGTMDEYTSEHGNHYHEWTADDHETYRVEMSGTDDRHAPTSTGDECTDECADTGSHTLTDGCTMCVYVHEDGTTCEGDECTADLVHYTADEDGTPYALTRTMFTEDEAR